MRFVQFWQGKDDLSDEFVAIIDCPEPEYEILAEEWQGDGYSLTASIYIGQDVTIWPTNRPLTPD